MERVPGADRLMSAAMSRVTGDAVLQVKGRRSGRLRTTLARTISVDGQRYLVAIRGETNWACNLRASGEAGLNERGRSIRIKAVELDGEERRALLRAFAASSRFAPTRRILTEVLPDAEQHPVFRFDRST
jgi:deazaflavin-dependent oxidoreductase (nitroreductase family)